MNVKMSINNFIALSFGLLTVLFSFLTNNGALLTIFSVILLILGIYITRKGEVMEFTLFTLFYSAVFIFYFGQAFIYYVNGK